MKLKTIKNKAIEAKKRIVLKRINYFEDAIEKGRGYLINGDYVCWDMFKPTYMYKHEIPSQDWVRNEFIPYQERKLMKWDKQLEKLEIFANKVRKRKMKELEYRS